MNETQKSVIKCAYADLVGAYQTCSDISSDHDWDAHRETIYEMEAAFDFIEPIDFAI